ncbi:hypothetical protein IT084_02615 [Desulfallas sp. Bu1-1]|uniref:hypothetical protein n=1 Tax=Desulfallas sp. Bu1-1 TaxID=2787620 RepID=UPI0018A0B5C0|nr:hypothetical protein [Desulfallas sp. Bu1-1]MBF7081867.1 hypothetical protein [Desulfallas sp. Bu1-1]
MGENLSPKNIEYYYKKNRFINLIFTSKKWRDLIKSKEAFVSLVLAIIFSMIIREIYQTNSTQNFCSLIGMALLTLSAGLLGVLGFLVGGLAIISGTISNKILKNINTEDKFDHLINIVFVFYFNGALVGFTLVLFLSLYLSLYTNWSISELKVFIISLIINYFFWFTIIYAVMLLGTCLRLLVLTYKFENERELTPTVGFQLQPKSNSIKKQFENQ